MRSTKRALAKVGAKERRAEIVEFAYNATQGMSTRKRLLQSCWTNFGLYLPLDGSKDGAFTRIPSNAD